jgi:hypothetical protein
MRSSLVALAAAVVASGGHPALAGHYKSVGTCSFEFDYPDDWSVTMTESSDPRECTARLRPKDFADRMEKLDVDLYTIDLVVFSDRNFLEVAMRYGFDFYKGAWVSNSGRDGMRTEASMIRIGPWYGLQVETGVGCHHEGVGGYWGICYHARAVLRDEEDRIWAMDSGPEGKDAFAQVLSTFSIGRQ